MKLSKLISVSFLLTLLAFAQLAFTYSFSKKNTDSSDDRITVVTTFYPVYIAALNVADGVEGIDIVNLTASSEGCVHDYTLSTADMKKLSSADLIIKNGFDMEMWLDSAFITCPIMCAGDSIDPICNDEVSSYEHGHNHEVAIENEHFHEHGSVNGHVWISPRLYCTQVSNIAVFLSELDPSNKELYHNNADIYIKKISYLISEIEETSEKIDSDTSAALFHDSFMYLFKDFGITVDYCTTIEGDTPVSAGEVAEAINTVRENNSDFIICETQYSESEPLTVSEETGTRLIALDSCVTGISDKNAYLNSMSKNIQIIQEAISK